MDNMQRRIWLSGFLAIGGVLFVILQWRHVRIEAPSPARTRQIILLVVAIVLSLGHAILAMNPELVSDD